MLLFNHFSDFAYLTKEWCLVILLAVFDIVFLAWDLLL